MFRRRRIEVMYSARREPLFRYFKKKATNFHEFSRKYFFHYKCPSFSL